MSFSHAIATLFILGSAQCAATKPQRPIRPSRTELSHPCSRSWSRIVRQRFDIHVRKKSGGSSSMQWPDKCPFNPLVNLFGWHEKNKTRSAAGEWQSNYSGKIFKSEHYIDLNMEKMYSNEMPKNGACLADYCQVFEFCNVTEPSLLDFWAAEPPPCDPSELELQKHMCDNVIDLCVPLEQPEKQFLNEQLHSVWCDRLTCDSRAERHHHHRKWLLIISGIVLVFVLGIFFLCVCIDHSDIDSDKTDYKTHKLSGRRIPLDPDKKKTRRIAGEDKVRDSGNLQNYLDEDVADILPTKLNKNKYE